MTSATITTSQKQKMQEILSQFLPASALHYCFQLWEEEPFSFLVTKKRSSKLGDYKYHYQKKTHTITINHNLNPYSFLVTYLHEVAHLITFKKYQKKALPHGNEWKQNFRNLLLPMMEKQVFPTDVLLALQNHIAKPKAASCSDPVLQLALRNHDYNAADQLILKQIPTGNSFYFRKKKYVKEAMKRTRAVCLEVHSGKRYLIPVLAHVEAC